MSRRESCVWHPMPEEVRRSSIQSRRASLAAGRRASVAKDQPDWEVEAAPAAPTQSRAAPEVHDTYPTEDEPVAAAAHDTYPTEDEPAVAATREVEAVPTPVESVPTPVESVPTPVQEDTYPTEEEAPAAAVERAVTPIEEAPVVVHEEPTAAVEREPVEEASHEPVEETQPAPKKAARAKTRHTIHFRGSKWEEVKSANAEALQAAFLEDIKDGAGVEAEEAKSINFEVKSAMTATFMMYHSKDDRSRMQTVHQKLQEYAFPNVCALYPPASDDEEEL